MITDKLILWWVSLFDHDTETAESMKLPGWVDDASGYAGTVYGYADSLGAWVNWALLGTVVSAVLLSVIVGFGIKVSRLGASAVSGRSL